MAGHRTRLLLGILTGCALLAGIPTAKAACNIINGAAFGDCAGVTINNTPAATMMIIGNEAVSGIIAGATVAAGGSLSLSGISNGDIEVAKGAALLVTGMVNGTIRNMGGSVTIDGTASAVTSVGGIVEVSGMVGTISGSGRLLLAVGAIVDGSPILDEVDRQMGHHTKDK